MRVLHVVGARPNFMKAASVHHAISRFSDVHQLVVHTGQHYDINMSEVFFEQLRMPSPDVNLQVGSGSHAVQTAEIMRRFEPIVSENRPDWVLVYGDVNSTIAAALVCSKLQIRVAHVEAGLRSFDRTMPEEINRLLTDQISDLLFTPSQDGNQNLIREGIAAEKIHLVGNVMIDTLVRMLPHCAAALPEGIPDSYALITLHRPANVDDIEWLQELVRTLERMSEELAVVFPVHPRTRDRMRAAGVAIQNRNIRLLDPMPYLSFLAMQKKARVVITDSGGIQEETTFLGVPCLTVRENTERPVTVELGTNQLVGRDLGKLARAVESVLTGAVNKGRIPPLWDGGASDRLAAILYRD